MRAVKDNKVYDITEAQKASYLKQGYNIADDTGKIIEYAPTATVSYSEYVKVKKELNEAKAEIAATKKAKSGKTTKSEDSGE